MQADLWLQSFRNLVAGAIKHAIGAVPMAFPIPGGHIRPAARAARQPSLIQGLILEEVLYGNVLRY